MKTKITINNKEYEAEIKDKDSPPPINCGVSTFNLAVEKQKDKAKKFLESLKDNSSSEIPNNSSD